MVLFSLNEFETQFQFQLLLTVAERGGSVLPRHFIIGVFDAYRLKLTCHMSFVFLMPKKSIRGLRNVISGQFSVHFR